MVPAFDLQGGVALAAARATSVAGLLSAFGTVVFRSVVAPQTFGDMPGGIVVAVKRRVLLVAQISVLASLFGTGAWLVVQAGNMADALTLAGALDAVPTVTAKTYFGHVLAAQFIGLVCLAAVLGWRGQVFRPRLASCVGAIVVALQAGHSHAASMYRGPSILLAMDAMHLLGAGAWLGGLLPLLLVVRDAPPRAGALAARWFSPLGQWCIVALAGSALFQGWVLVASVPGLVGTAYGWIVIIKLALFGALLCFAYANRFAFAPALLRDDPVAARRVFLRSIGAQTGFALAIIAAAAVLSELPPSMHVQALWPFEQQISFEAVREDPDFRHEVVLAALALLGAIAAVVAALFLRRWRIAAAVVASMVAWEAVPHFGLLLATAYPTSFYHSPTAFSSETIVEGAGLFAAHCVACHGADGAGEGVLAKKLPVPPADLTAGHLWMHSDGELFWWISAGIKAPEGGQAMPSFAGVLTEDQRWALIDFLHAHNAGTAFRASGDWPQPVQAPGLEAQCGARSVQLADLRGRFVRLVIGPARAATGDAVTIATQEGGAKDACVAGDESVTDAYAIVSGIAPNAMSGAQFLIDGAGVLRAVQRAGSGAGWNDPKTLAAEIVNLRARKMPSPADTRDKMNMPM